MVLKESDYTQLTTGSLAPFFSLQGADGKKYSLDDFKGSKAVLVVFMCNHCPYVKPKIQELNRIAQDYKDKRLMVIGINSNEDQNYPEDSFDNMKKLVDSGDISFPYLRDDTQNIAKAYGAVCTPDPFLFDHEFKLIFHSRIDNSHGDEPASTHELYNAIGEFLDKGNISVEEKPSMGCSIKWK